MAETCYHQGKPWQAKTVSESFASSEGKKSGLNQPSFVMRWLGDHREEHREQPTDHFPLGNSKSFRSHRRLLRRDHFSGDAVHVCL